MSHRRLGELGITDLFIGADDASYTDREGRHQDVPADLRHELEIMYRKALAEQAPRFRIVHDGLGWRATRMLVVDGRTLFVFRPNTPAVPNFRETLGHLPPPLLVDLEGAGRANGLLLVVGAPVQGKTWTASAVFARWMDVFGPVGLTLEEPPEMPLQGRYSAGRVFQVDVRERGLEAAGEDALRQGARMLLIGEILGREAARVAVRLGQAGLSVIATMHAGDTGGAIERLHDMLVAGGHDDAPTALALGLQGVLHQRLAQGRRPEVAWLKVNNAVRGIIQNKRWVGLREEQRAQTATVGAGRAIGN